MTKVPINDPKHWRERAKEARAMADQMGEPDPGCFELLLLFRRKSKHEKRLFICERRLRNPHAPRFFSGPKTFRGAVTQYLPSRAYRLFTGSLEVREFHSYAVDFDAIIFYMEIVSRHDTAPTLPGGSTGLSVTDARGITADDQ